MIGKGFKDKGKNNKGIKIMRLRRKGGGERSRSDRGRHGGRRDPHGIPDAEVAEVDIGAIPSPPPRATPSAHPFPTPTCYLRSSSSLGFGGGGGREGELAFLPRFLPTRYFRRWCRDPRPVCIGNMSFNVQGGDCTCPPPSPCFNRDFLR